MGFLNVYENYCLHIALENREGAASHHKYLNFEERAGKIIH